MRTNNNEQAATCCICGKDGLYHPHKNNPDPWPECRDIPSHTKVNGVSYCCTECNSDVVIPLRVAMRWQGFTYKHETDRWYDTQGNEYDLAPLSELKGRTDRNMLNHTSLSGGE